MQIGLIFPRSDIGADAGAIRAFAEAAEDLGYSHISIEEHVLGVDPNRDGWDYGPRGRGNGMVITNAWPFSEPLVLAAFLAALTRRIRIDTTILILPQRPAALVAKQVAELANLSEGRFRLGVGSGWNPVEFAALGADFRQRGPRQEEQVEVMRRLWGEESVDFHGRWHDLDGVGINPRPRYPIPIWFGGQAEALLKRVARVGDGWIPGVFDGTGSIQGLDLLRTFLAEEGRDPDTFPVEVFYHTRDKTPDRIQSDLDAMRALGVTHASVSLNPGDPEPLTRVLDRMRRFGEQVQRPLSP